MEEMTGTCAAVLLDRDGTVIVERHYLHDPEQVVLEVGVGEALKSLQRAGLKLVIITNQSGVGRGYFDLAAVVAVNQRVDKLLAAEGVIIAGWYICPHVPADECECRKPRAGLARAAAKDLRIDLTRSWIVGDKLSDVNVASLVGSQAALVATGHGQMEREAAKAAGHLVFETMSDVADFVINSEVRTSFPALY